MAAAAPHTPLPSAAPHTATTIQTRRSGKAAKADGEASQWEYRICRKEKHRLAGGCGGCDPHVAGCKDGARVTGCGGCNPTAVCFFATVNRRADGMWIVGECRPFTCNRNHAGRLRIAATAYTSAMLMPLFTGPLQAEPKTSTKALTAILAAVMNLAPSKSMVVEVKKKAMDSLYGARRTCPAYNHLHRAIPGSPLAHTRLPCTCRSIELCLLPGRSHSHCGVRRGPQSTRPRMPRLGDDRLGNGGGHAC